jgi:pentatricopeptide repeat protein
MLWSCFLLRNAAIRSTTCSKTIRRTPQSIHSPQAKHEPHFGSQSHSSASLLLQPRFNGAADLREGKRLHAHIIKIGAAFEENKLVNMYASFDSLDDVRRVFETMPERNEVVWNSTIAAYARLGHGEEALQLFHQIGGGELKPTPFVFATVVSACTGIAGIGEGKQIHTQIIKTGIPTEKCNHSTAELGEDLADLCKKKKNK